MNIIRSNLALAVSVAVVAIPLCLCLTLYAQGRRLQRLDADPVVHPKNYTFNTDDIATVFCQGNGASRAQAAKYAGPEGLTVRVDSVRTDHVSIANAPRLLWNLYPWADLDDIGYGFSWNPVHWISMCMHAAVLRLGYNLEGMRTLPYNKPGALNVAGPRDVSQYLLAVRQCIEQNPTKRIVLFGTSRGASTVLIAMRHLTDEDRKHVALALVEGPFDTIKHVTDCRFGRAAPLVRWAMRTFGLYRESQESPLDAVKHTRFPLDIPLGFIRSEVDDIVPAECTRPLITALWTRNHTALETRVLARSHHSRMSVDDAQDQEQYLRFVYGLYDRYVK